MDNAAAWECQRSVDVAVPVSFAWAYMTDIRNWNDPPAEFALEGPFVEGTRGTTQMPGRPLASWTIRDVEPGRGYTIEGILERGVLLVPGDSIHYRNVRRGSHSEWSCTASMLPLTSTRSNRSLSQTWSRGCEGSHR